MHGKIRTWTLAGVSLAAACLNTFCNQAVAPVAVAPTQVGAATSTVTIPPTATGVPTMPPTAMPMPTASPTSTQIPATPTVFAAPISSGPLKLDIDTIFPAGKGRDLVLNNCTICHTFLRIVVGQRTQDQWEYVRRDMRNKVSQLSDQDVDTLFGYLEANFNETKPVPALPDWFLQTGEW